MIKTKQTFFFIYCLYVCGADDEHTIWLYKMILGQESYGQMPTGCHRTDTKRPNVFRTKASRSNLTGQTSTE